MKPYAFAAVFLLLLMLGGCPAIPYVAEDERSMSTEFRDGKIEADIKSRLIESGLGKAYNVNVYCFRGHVYLVGEADAAFAERAEKAARSAPGTRRVTARWFAVGSSDRSSDTTIEAAIDAKLLVTPNLASTRVDVDVWGGNVVLLGIAADRAEVDKAAKVARGVDGVKSVTNYMLTNEESLSGR